ncbi:MAG: hypothetical protein OXU66_05040 [Gammaproteobacteria bacterium]|nr:hypothetical protein [Gammaproteobacteria bacterium]MDD9894803.1 hypothetical protein [Gammaproteobacteria bacterium]MDD9958288.1 hypothetical protein [Gammaproteobacteria bacterium]
MHNRITLSQTLLAIVGFLLAPLLMAQSSDIPRTASGRPDLSGTYDVSTRTPMQRAPQFGDRRYFTNDEAAVIAADDLARKEERQRGSDPNRSAPPQGGDGSSGASGNVGGYNTFWIDDGTDAFQIDGRYPTSIIYDPPNGRMPEVNDAVRAERRARFSEGELAVRREGGQNDGTAYWLNLGLDAPGPYDNMEQRPFAERCLLSFSSTGGPPMLPALYNNHKRIVQSEDTILIHIEMVHEARIVRMNAEHDPQEIRKWLGDSIGWWEGDTLVVETTNFRDVPAFSQGSRDMKVTERFRMESADRLIYSFTVEDPSVWTAPFSGEYAWPRSPNKVFEYACHEANYALEGIMKGARLLEAEFRGEDPGGVPNPTQ